MRKLARAPERCREQPQRIVYERKRAVLNASSLHIRKANLSVLRRFVKYGLIFVAPIMIDRRIQLAPKIGSILTERNLAWNSHQDQSIWFSSSIDKVAALRLRCVYWCKRDILMRDVIGVHRFNARLTIACFTTLRMFCYSRLRLSSALKVWTFERDERIILKTWKRILLRQFSP